MRCEANISVAPASGRELGVKVEIKNMNSIRNLERAMQYEVERQLAALKAGEQIVQETRHWDEKRQETVPMRSKETAPDYRYFPEPDLPPVAVPRSLVKEIGAALPELPAAKKQRFCEKLGLSPYDAGVLVADKELAAYFEACLEHHAAAKSVANWLANELLGRLNKLGQEIGECRVKPKQLAGLLEMVEGGKLSGKQAKDVLDEMVANGADAAAVAKQKGLSQISDSGELEKIVDEVIGKNPGPVAEFKGGKEKALGFLMGQVMKLSKGKANPNLASKMLKEKLK